MHTAVHIGIGGGVDLAYAIDDTLRFLRCGCVVKIDKRLAIDGLLQYGELFAYFVGVQHL